MNTAGAIVLTIVVLLLIGGVGWLVYTRIRAQRLGLPAPSLTSYLPFGKKSSSSRAYGPPQPAPGGGVVGWVNDRIRKLRTGPSRSAAYEPAGGGGGRRTGGFGPLDPDEAWDASVGYEADRYYEDQELGLGGHTTYGGGGGSGGGGVGAGVGGGGAGGGGGGGSYEMNLARPAEVQEDEEDAGGRGRTRVARRGDNPFDDDAADPSNLSMRAVSPRPIDTAAAAAAAAKGKPAHKHSPSGDSPTERRSIFREDV